MKWRDKFRSKTKKHGSTASGRWKRILPAALCVLLVVGLLYDRSKLVCLPPSDVPLSVPSESGLFSWSSEMVNQPEGDLFPLMKQMGLNVLYQGFSSKSSPEQMFTFLEKAMAEGVKVYQLTGSRAWGLDPEGAKLRQAVERVADYNRKTENLWMEQQGEGMPQGSIPRLTGIMFDVEVYLLDEWDEDPDKVMHDFVSGMKKAYALAKGYGLEIIVCVPWYYDKKGQTEGLEELIRDGCDAIAVMNYYRGAEVKNIATEVKLASKYGKELINIYELQKADGRGIKEVNTYHDRGLDAVRENYSNLLKAYPGEAIPIAYHEYRALRELLGEVPET